MRKHPFEGERSEPEKLNSSFCRRRQIDCVGLFRCLFLLSFGAAWEEDAQASVRGRAKRAREAQQTILSTSRKWSCLFLSWSVLVGCWCRMGRGCASIRSRASVASPSVLFVCLVGVFVWLVVGLVGVFVWLVCWFGLVEWVFMMNYCLVGLHASTVSGLYPNCSRYTPHLNPLRGSKL